MQREGTSGVRLNIREQWTRLQSDKKHFERHKLRDSISAQAAANSRQPSA
jgi:hypothetical protein